MAADGLFIEGFLPVAVLALALLLGPLPIVVRGLIRAGVGRRHVHRWHVPAAIGVGLGMCAAAVTTVFHDPQLTLDLVLLCLLVLLASIDWQWRWLPIEWTLGVIALGLIHALASDDAVQIMLQAIVPAVSLLLMRQVIQLTLKKDALGLGDVWLIAGLGAFLPIYQTFLLVGLAALSGLLEVALRRFLQPDGRKITGVSYGTHLCVVFVFLQSFSQSV